MKLFGQPLIFWIAGLVILYAIGGVVTFWVIYFSSEENKSSTKYDHLFWTFSFVILLFLWPGEIYSRLTDDEEDDDTTIFPHS